MDNIAMGLNYIQGHINIEMAALSYVLESLQALPQITSYRQGG